MSSSFPFNVADVNFVHMVYRELRDPFFFSDIAGSHDDSIRSMKIDHEHHGEHTHDATFETKR